MFVFGRIYDGVRVPASDNLEVSHGQDEGEGEQVIYEEDEIDEVEVEVDDHGGQVQDPLGGDNPFITPDVPRRLSRVDCDPPRSALSVDQIRRLGDFLRPRMGSAHTMIDMNIRYQLWKDTMGFCRAHIFI